MYCLLTPPPTPPVSIINVLLVPVVDKTSPALNVPVTLSTESTDPFTFEILAVAPLSLVICLSTVKSESTAVVKVRSVTTLTVTGTLKKSAVIPSASSTSI